MKKATIVLALFLAVAAASCSGGSSDGTTTTTKPSGTSTTSTTIDPATLMPKTGKAQILSISYQNEFKISECETVPKDDESITLTASKRGVKVQAEATKGAGTVSVKGGTGAEKITLNGTITSADVSKNGEFTIEATYGDPNFAGEPFTLRGTCS